MIIFQKTSFERSKYWILNSPWNQGSILLCACWALTFYQIHKCLIYIHYNGKLQTHYSIQYFIACCTFYDNCYYDGYPSANFSYWKSNRIPIGDLYIDTIIYNPYYLPIFIDNMHILCWYRLLLKNLPGFIW